jgi:NhaP-type Na+/H+ or K+/H+ antiporter
VSVIYSTPGFSGDESKPMNGGVSPANRSVIIGVTVGIGGAILLAAGGFLFWRLRNKRRTQEESEELISYGAGFGGPGTAEKSEASGPSAAARSPFQSTLETYHAPTQANAASNF